MRDFDPVYAWVKKGVPSGEGNPVFPWMGAGLPAWWGRYPLGVSFERAKETKTRLGRSPLSTPLGYEATPAVVLRPGRKPVPYQEGKKLCFSLLLLEKCAFLQVSALSGPPGPRRPGIGRTPPNLRPWQEKRNLPAEQAYPREVIRHLCDPSGLRADYGPTAQNKIKSLGFQRGRAPFVAFRSFWPDKMDPSGASLPGTQDSTREMVKIKTNKNRRSRRFLPLRSVFCLVFKE